MKITKLLFGIFALQLIGTSAIIAQNNTMTPYSRYGYGILLCILFLPLNNSKVFFLLNNSKVFFSFSDRYAI